MTQINASRKCVATEKKKKNMYTNAVTVVGDFKGLTKGAGKAREKDLLGFRTKPFIAHAWVEANGQPVEEDMELSEFLISLEAGEVND